MQQGYRLQRRLFGLVNEVIRFCSVLGGDVGKSGWYDIAPNLRPEAGLLALRKGLRLFANIRPAILLMS